MALLGPKKGGLRKRLNRHLFCFYMPQLGDDGDLLSTLPFNATPHVLGQEPPQVKNTKKPCLISFNIFRPSFGDVLIHERLSVGLFFYTKDMQKICSNMCFMLKPDKAFPPRVGHQLLRRRQRPGYPDNLKNFINVSFFLHDDVMCTRKKFPIVLEVDKLADWDIEKVRDLNANSAGRAASNRRQREGARPEGRAEAPPPADGGLQAH